MKLIYTLFFLLSAIVVSAQNDSIYPLQKVLHIGDTLTMVFKAKAGSMQLATDGNCDAKLVYRSQTLKPTGWPDTSYLFGAQMDCGLPYVEIPNGIKAFYKVGYPGTYRLVFLSNNKMVITDSYTVE